MRSKTSYNPCESYRKLFSEYLDGVLDATERMNIHNHLKECVPCSRELEKLSGTLAMLADFQEESIPQAFKHYRLPRFTFIEIFPSIRTDEQQNRAGFWAPYMSAVALLLLVLTSWVAWQHDTPKKPYYSSNYIEVVAKI